MPTLISRRKGQRGSFFGLNGKLFKITVNYKENLRIQQQMDTINANKIKKYQKSHHRDKGQNVKDWVTTTVQNLIAKLLISLRYSHILGCDNSRPSNPDTTSCSGWHKLVPKVEDENHAVLYFTTFTPQWPTWVGFYKQVSLN